MTERQGTLLAYHHDVAFFATSHKAPVFVILDLEDSVGLEIASHFQGESSEKWDTIKTTGAYPALTLALAVKDANALLGHGWPGARKIGKIPESMIPVILISEGRCLVVLIRR
jgi:hypothetical protein